MAKETDCSKDKILKIMGDDRHIGARLILEAVATGLISAGKASHDLAKKIIHVGRGIKNKELMDDPAVSLIVGRLADIVTSGDLSEGTPNGIIAAMAGAAYEHRVQLIAEYTPNDTIAPPRQTQEMNGR